MDRRFLPAGHTVGTVSSPQKEQSIWASPPGCWVINQVNCQTGAAAKVK